MHILVGIPLHCLTQISSQTRSFPHFVYPTLKTLLNRELLSVLPYQAPQQTNLKLNINS